MRSPPARERLRALLTQDPKYNTSIADAKSTFAGLLDARIRRRIANGVVDQVAREQTERDRVAADERRLPVPQLDRHRARVGRAIRRARRAKRSR